METVELKRIWNTLAENKLIDKELAKENILKIISKKGTGIISKMKRSSKIQSYFFFFGFVVMPIIILFIMIYNNHYPQDNTLSQNMRGYVPLFFWEILMIYGFMNSVSNLKFLCFSHNTGSIKESLITVKSHFIANSKKAYWVGVLFIELIFITILIDILTRISSITHLDFSFTPNNLLSSYFLIFVIIALVVTPFLLKTANKNFSCIIEGIDQTIDEINEVE